MSLDYWFNQRYEDAKFADHDAGHPDGLPSTGCRYCEVTLTGISSVDEPTGEYHKCGKLDCFRKVSLASRFCCPSCSTAAEAPAPYEIEPYDPAQHPTLVHSRECEERRVQRGEYDPRRTP